MMRFAILALLVVVASCSRSQNHVVIQNKGSDTLVNLAQAWAEELKRTPDRAVANPKSVLQEWAQGQGRPLPSYRIVARSGSDHAPTFTVETVIEGFEPATAEGRSRQDAEKAAATAMLKREGVI